MVSLSVLVLGIISYRMARSWFFPPALFAVYWAFIIAASMIIRLGNYSLTVDSLLVFLVGCIVFSAGGYAALLLSSRVVPQPAAPAQRITFIQLSIVIFSVGLLAIVPFFIDAIERAGHALGIARFAIAARVVFGLPDQGGIPRYFKSLTSIGSVLAPCAAWLYDGTRRSKATLLLAVLAPLTMSVLTFSRSPVYALIIGVMAILAFRKVVRLHTVAIVIAFTAGIALTMGTLLDKGPSFGFGNSPVGAVVENLSTYFLGGPLAFDQVMSNPLSVGEHGLSLRFFTQAAKSAGAEIVIPNNVLGYGAPGLGNVYTFYYAYWLDWGWLGIVGVAFLAGFLCTAIYAMASLGNATAGVALSLMVGSVLTSSIGDGFFGSAIPWLLIVSVTLILWHAPKFRISTVSVFRTANKPTSRDYSSAKR